MATFTNTIDDKTVEITTNNPTEIVTLTAQGWKRLPDPAPKADPKPAKTDAKGGK
ncbi:hypothetical protein [Actinomyces qiguomingii]|uniref:hypothetical protein n=1 Tax=Actinomyces qiguomingii TaxID=2057800 RepID=UPI0013049311|nr:hypothetical protein [Actinomyces qiguomingii]